VNHNRYFCAYPTAAEGLAAGGLRYLCLVLTPETRRPERRVLHLSRERYLPVSGKRLEGSLVAASEDSIGVNHS
jgi:hypothetical protein